jgi:hypothetical protein
MTSRHGGISLRLPGDARFRVDAEAERGEVISDFHVDEERSGPDGAHQLKLRTQRGNIRLQTFPEGVQAAAGGAFGG